MPGGGADSKPAFSLTTAVQSAPRTRPATNHWRPGDCSPTNHELRLRVGPSLHLRLPTKRESTSSFRQSPPATASFPSLSPSLYQSKCSLSTPRPANQGCDPSRLCVCSQRQVSVASEQPVPPTSSFSSVWFEGSGGKPVCGGLHHPRDRFGSVLSACLLEEKKIEFGCVGAKTIQIVAEVSGFHG